MVNPYRCTAHPELEAGWHCESCGRDLCPACTANIRVQEAVTSYDVCVHCEGRATQLQVPGAPESARSRLRQVFQMPAGLFSVGLLISLYFLLSELHHVESVNLGIAFAALLALVFWVAFFTIVHATARGTDEVRAARIDATSFIVAPAARALVWSATWLLPFVAVQRARGLSMDQWLDDAGAVMGCVFLAAIAPASLVVLARGSGVLEAISPRRLEEVRRQLGDDWPVAGLLILGALFFSLFQLGAADFVWRHGFDAGLILMRTFALYAQFLTARTVGILLDVHGYAVGYPEAKQRLVPVLGRVEPTGTRKPKPPDPPPKPREALEVDLSPERSNEAPSPAQQVEGVLAFLRSEDFNAAVAAYGHLPESLDAWLSVASLLTLGQAAAGRERYGLAVRALKAAARKAPEDPLAPKACIVLARLYAERVGDAASAQKLFRHVIQRYPGTDAARFAQSRLLPPP